MAEIHTLDLPRRPMKNAIALNEAERAFILHRLCAVSMVAQALSNRLGPGVHRTIVERAWRLVVTLRSGQPLVVHNQIDEALVVEAIEGNTYFTEPSRVVAEHVTLADRLRARLSLELGRSIRQFAIATGDDSPPEAA